MKKTYMLDTNICSFIMREQPVTLLQRLQDAVVEQHKIVISAITYAEMRFGVIGKKASPKHEVLVDEFIKRIDEILPWDRKAVEATILVKKHLNDTGKPIGDNDTAIAGHAISAKCMLITNNVKHFGRVTGLNFEDWSDQG